MKTKLITVALMSVLLIGCGKSEEEKNKDSAKAMQIEHTQEMAFVSAVTELHMLKGPVAVYYSESKKCSEDILKSVNTKTEYTKMIDKISVSESSNGCQLKATFKELDSIPDLSKESITLTMIPDGRGYTWSCKFTGNNKEYIAKICR